MNRLLLKAFIRRKLSMEDMIRHWNYSEGRMLRFELADGSGIMVWVNLDRVLKIVCSDGINSKQATIVFVDGTTELVKFDPNKFTGDICTTGGTVVKGDEQCQ